MQIRDGVKLKGRLGIRVLDANTRRVIREIKTPNQICVGSLEALVRLAAQTSVHGGTSEDYEETRVWAIYAGDGSTPPLSVDASLDSVQFKKACDQPLVVNYSAGTFTAQMTIESGEGNGITYTEIGLFTRGDNDDPALTSGALMMARQLHGSIAKTAAIAIEYTWTIQFTL